MWLTMKKWHNFLPISFLLKFDHMKDVPHPKNPILCALIVIWIILNKISSVGRANLIVSWTPGSNLSDNKPKVWSVQLEKTLNLSIKFSVPPSTTLCEAWKIFGSKKEIWVQKIFGLKKYFGSKKNLGPKKFLGPKKILGP